MTLSYTVAVLLWRLEGFRRCDSRSSMAEGPAAGLELVEALESSGELAGYHLLPAFDAPGHRPPQGESRAQTVDVVGR